MAFPPSAAATHRLCVLLSGLGRRPRFLGASSTPVFPRGFASDSSSSSAPPRQRLQQLECWRCEHIIRCPVAFCPGCEVVQPLDETQPANAFEAFGITPKFDVDLDEVADRYKAIQKKMHPDVFETKSQSEKEFAAKQSMRLNRHYETVRNPVQRAIELLRIEGVEWTDRERLDDEALLWELLELREQAEGTDDPDVLAHVRGVVVEGLEHDQQRFAQAMQTRDLGQARDATCRMMYRSRLLGFVCTKQPVS